MGGFGPMAFGLFFEPTRRYPLLRAGRQLKCDLTARRHEIGSSSPCRW